MWEQPKKKICLRKMSISSHEGNLVVIHHLIAADRLIFLTARTINFGSSYFYIIIIEYFSLVIQLRASTRLSGAIKGCANILFVKGARESRLTQPVA